MSEGVKTPTVLLVDDQPTILRTLTRFLEAKGFTVEIATSVGEAIPVLEARAVDAVVLDMRLPGESGLDLLARMREDERWRHLPAVVLTGASLTNEDRATLARLRAYVFLKPKSYEALSTHLANAVRAASR